MSAYDFDDLDDEFIDNGEPDINEHQEKTEHSEKRRRLEDLLEEKRLRAEIAEYDKHLSQKQPYYSDDIFDD